MPPSATAYAPAADAARGPTAAEAGLRACSMWFNGVPITERQAFPPAIGPQCWVYLTLNAEIALSMPHNWALQRLVQQPRVRVSVDGQWLWWALRRKYPEQPLAKLSGSDLIYQLAAHCERHQMRLHLLGSTAEANDLAVKQLQARHPTLMVSGFAPAPYRLGDPHGEAALTAAALAAIEASRPNYVVLGLGADKEQRLALALAPRLDQRVAGLLCFGGAIDMASGRVRRAPRWMQVGGLEALYRVWQQPARLPRLLRVLRLLPTLVAGRY